MKKHFKLIAVVLLLATLLLFLFACGGQNDTDGTATIVVLDGENTQVYTVDLSKLPTEDTQMTGLMAVLEYLKENEGLTYNAQDGYLTQVNGIVEGPGVFVALYTDVESDMSASAEPFTITYDGVEYISSDFGASSMCVKSGCTIIIAKGTY